MNKIVARLREACAGGRECQCSYRLGADEIERLEYQLARAMDEAAKIGVELTLARREAEAAKLRAEEADGLYRGLLAGTDHAPDRTLT